MKYDCVVVGAGFAGATIAEKAASKGKSVLIIEQRDHIGGNCYDYTDENGIIIQKYGPHIFHTNIREVWEYLSQFTDWIPYKHKVLANLNGKIVSLPVSLKTLYQLFDKTTAEIVEKKLIGQYGAGNKVSIQELMMTTDSDLNSIAQEIFEKIFKNYSKKQWDIDPLKLDKQVLNRLPIWVDYEDFYFKDKYQGIPKEGYTKLIQNMLNKPNIEIILSKDFKDLVEGILFEKLYYAGPIDYYFDYKYGKLPYRGSEFSLETLDVEYFQSNSVVNYPGNEPFTRITEFKHFNGYKSNKTAIMREYSNEYVSGKNIPSYPIPTDENHKKYDLYKNEAKQLKNIAFTGRLGEYKYYNMDEVVEKALVMAENN